MSNFNMMYPRCAALHLSIVDAGPGFDELDVEKALGTTRFNNLTSKLTRVFCANHAKYDTTVANSHRIKGYERHCIYAEDLEAFLAQGG